MLNYHIKIALLSLMIFIHYFIVGSLLSIVNYEFYINTGSHIDPFLTDFSIKGALLPILIIIAPILSIYYTKNPYKIIRFCLGIGVITYTIYFIFLNDYSIFKIIILLIGFAVIITNIYLLIHEVIKKLEKYTILAICFFYGCYPLIIKNILELVDYLIEVYKYKFIQFILIFIALMFFVMFITYSKLFKDNNLSDISFLKTLKRYPIYIINFFKKVEILQIGVLSFFFGITLGLGKQYALHYFSEFNYNDLHNNSLFWIFIRILLIVLLIIIGVFIYNQLKKLKVIAYLSILITSISIVVFLIFKNNYLSNIFLFISNIWFYTYLPYMTITYYFLTFNKNKISLVMIVADILFIFGCIISFWINILFTDITIPLYIEIFTLFCIVYLIKKFKFV